MNKRLDYIRTKKYEDLSKDEIQYLRDKKILNGFGGASQSWIVRWLIGIILADFDKAIPDKHDFGYWQGVIGLLEMFDEEFLEKLKKYSPKAYRVLIDERRKEYDEKFYQAMLDDIRARYDDGMIGKWGLTWKSFVALGAYGTIRWNGSEFFNYS